MTLNGHFALKSVSGSASNGLTCSSSGQQNCCEICRAIVRIYCQRQKCSAGTIVAGDISFVGLFAGVPWRVASVSPSISSPFRLSTPSPNGLSMQVVGPRIWNESFIFVPIESAFGASSSRSPVLPTKPYLLDYYPACLPLFIPETYLLHSISYLAFVWL